MDHRTPIDPDTTFAESEREELLKLARYRMPFGKYKGRLLLDLPEPYVVWFRQKGFPKGELGRMFATLYEIKANGLESLLRPLSMLEPPENP